MALVYENIPARCTECRRNRKIDVKWLTDGFQGWFQATFSFARIFVSALLTSY